MAGLIDFPHFRFIRLCRYPQNRRGFNFPVKQHFAGTLLQKP
jgi:hypothetical protein